MHFTLWWTFISAALFLEVRCGLQHVIHYAESKCQRGRDDSITFRLAPSGWNSAAIIRATQLLSYSYPFNCNITVSVPNADDRHVLLRVRKVSFPTRAGCTNYVEIYEKNRSPKFCTKHDFPGKNVAYTNIGKNSMTFLYHTEYYSGSTHSFDDDFFFKGFEILATAYTKAPCGEELSFLCKNGRCISRELLFDGYDNCGDGSDESAFVAFRLTRGAIIGICITILLVIAAVSGAIYLVRRRTVTRIKTYTAAPTAAPAGPQPYPQQTFAPFPLQPQTPQYHQYGGIGNPNYGVPPPPYQ